MPRYIWINPNRLASTRREETVDGLEFIVELSPYDAPKAIEGRYDEQSGKFVISFEYIDKEPEKLALSEKGVEVFQGKHSGKVLSIHIAVDSPPLDQTAIIHLRTNVLETLERIEKQPFAKGKMNRSIARKLLSENLDEITEELVESK